MKMLSPALRRAVSAVSFLLLVSPAHAMVDLNGNGMSDVWETIYGYGLDPNGTDGSGLTNLQKSIAGLPPNNPNAGFRAAVKLSGSSTVVTWPSVLGKLYQIQSGAALGSGSWTNVGSPAPGTGAQISSTLSSPLPSVFYRVTVSDAYTNNGGLADWEALQLGLNPANAYSGGHLDANNQPLSDYQWVATALSSTNIVSVVATKPGATIPVSGTATDVGTITVTRSGNLNAITVPLATSGAAQPGVDYSALPAAVTLPLGVNSAKITVTPMAASRLLAGTPVNVAVTSATTYQVAASGTATVVIYPSGANTGTGLAGYYYASSSATYTSTANFNPSTLKVTRTDPQVNFYWGQGQPYTQVARNNFSATWDGQVLAPVTGAYLFAVQADAGARVYINNQLVADAWVAGSSTAAPIVSGSIALTAGSLTPIHVEYWENTDPASIYLTWETPGATSFASIPNADILRPGSSGSTGYNAVYYNNPTLSGTPAYSTVERSIYDNWGTGSPDPALSTTQYSVRWLGQVQPQYSEPYTFVTHTSEGTKLWVNGQLIVNNWYDQNAYDVSSTTINLQAGVRYDIQMDYYQDKLSAAQAYLSWYSPSQPQQIIPQTMLYPASGTVAPPSITSTTAAVALIGGSFNYVVTASNGGSGFTVTGLPPGLTFNPATGVIGGVPTQPGTYVITITATNGIGTGASTLTITAINTGGGITRNTWSAVAGVNVADIPLGTAPTVTDTVASLQSTSGTSNYGEQLLGYITPPVTGNYYFWLSGNSSAELWISDDSDPVNNLRRVAMTGPSGAPGLQSPLLSLTAGQRYFLQVLHKFGTGSGDNVTAGWLRPDQTGTSAAEVVPSYVLSPYTPPVNTVQPGTLYSTSLLAAAGVKSEGVGAATLLLNPGQTAATLNFSYANLTSGVTDTQLMSDPYLNKPSQTLLDITKLSRQNPDGSYTLNINNVGSLTAADVLEIIKEGKAYLAIFTANNPAGEIRGNFTLSNGAQTFSPPPAAPAYADDSSTDAGASRFLTQATFGPTPSEIARVKQLGYSAWIDDQFTRPASHLSTYILANPNPGMNPTYPDTLLFNSWWQQSITAPDQLRQRVAFALSEITVVSDIGALNNNGQELGSYYDTLLDFAFANYAGLLKAVTLTPAMGNYLNMRSNAKANYAAGLHPDENYAREINQLFSIGLYKLWPDGTLVENASGSLVPTYQQPAVQGFAAVFTGWNYHQPLQGNGRLPTSWYPAQDFVNPMTLVPAQHDQGAKLTLDNIVLPAATGSQTNASDPAYDSYAQGDLDSAIGIITNHPNVGPFICRQLIQRLVTSNPSRDYVYRVAQVFNDNGAGVRGDLKAVVKAILLDYEARSATAASQPGFGKQKEALLRVTAPARYFASTYSLSGTYTQSGSPAITISTSGSTRLVAGDTLSLGFTSGNPAPYSGPYGVASVSGNSFTVNMPGLVTGTYSQSGATITLALSHAFSTGDPVYLNFLGGGAVSGTYTVASVIDTSHFTVTSPSSATLSGTAVISHYTGGYVVSSSSSGQINTITTSFYHGLNPGDPVFVNFASGTAITGTYQVLSVADPYHFVIGAAGVKSQSQSILNVYPMLPPPWNRTGGVAAQTSTWNIGSSDGDLTQTPMNSPTVFNYFYPTYRFPGPLASAGLTTPEFQKTNATTVMLQTNFLEGGILSGRNTNGLMSFRNGGGSIEMDCGPYLGMTADASIPALVDLLNNQLMGGGMSASMRSAIISYVANTTNYPLGTPPTFTQQSNRARAVIHLIVTSPEFTIQQ